MTITPERLQQVINDLDGMATAIHPPFSPEAASLIENLRLASALLAALPGDVEVSNG